jgi:hypothetical protein
MDLGFREKTMMEIPGERIGTWRTQVHIPTVEDHYILLAIEYIIIIVLQGAAGGGGIVYRSNIFHLCSHILRGAPT